MSKTKSTIQVAIAIALAAASAVLALCVPASAAGGERGDLLSAQRIARLTGPQVVHAVRQWKEEGTLRLDASAVRNGVTAYRLIYQTVDTDGITPRTASGLVVVPDRRPNADVVAWEHGTTIDRRDAPSTGTRSDARLVAYLLAGSGSIAVAPDYLGLGAGPGSHPYNQRSSEVSASLDMLRAAREFLARKGRPWDGRVQIAGFSQGAKVAVALGGALQAGADPAFGVDRLAAIAGPYDLQGAQLPNLRRLDPIGSSLTLAYTAVAWKSLYGLYDTPDQVFKPPFDTTIERLFDGRHPQARVIAALRPPGAMFTPAFRQWLANPSGALLEGLQGSDGACRYAPAFPIRLYAARSDEQVSFANTAHCRRDFLAQGVDVPITNLGRHGHFGSEILAVPSILRWLKVG